MPTLALEIDSPGAKGDAGSTGATGAPGAGAVGLWQPSDNGFIAAPIDPALASSSFVATAGVLYLVRARMAVDSVITNMHAAVRSPAAVGLANTFLGVYTVGGTTLTLLAQTADVSTAMQGAADVKSALTAPTASQASGTGLMLAFLFGSATTAPTFRSAPGGDSAINLTTASPFRWATFGTGLTALPSTVTLSSTANSGSLPFLAAS